MNKKFIEKLSTFLESKEILSSLTELNNYNGCTYKPGYQTDLIIKPIPRINTPSGMTSLADLLVEILEVAKEFSQPIYTISTGKNWGYGSSTPKSANCVILDLSNFKEISDYDPINGTICVQPGVTQQHLYEYLIQQGDDFIIDATGGPKASSILGNICERGFGHTTKADHYKNLVNLSAVVPYGIKKKAAVTHTGFADFKNAYAANVYEYGIGPHTQGLFTQSNYGIVCNVTIKLMPKPEQFLAYFIKFADRDLIKFTDAMRNLKKAGIVESAAHIGNAHKAVQMAAKKYPYSEMQDKTPLSKKLFRKICEDYDIADWTMSGAFYGSNSIIQAKTKILKKALENIPHKIMILDENRLKVLKKLKNYFNENAFGKSLVPILSKIKVIKQNLNNLNMLDDLEALFYLKQGKPTDHFLRSIYYRKKDMNHSDSKKLDPNQDGVGLIWLAPIAPLEGKCAKELTDIISPICEKYSFEPTFSITLLTDTAMDCVVSIIFDRENEQEDKNALLCHDEIVLYTAKAGYFIYRQSTRASLLNMSSFRKTNELELHLKQYLDPLGIISPGHYIQ